MDFLKRINKLRFLQFLTVVTIIFFAFAVYVNMQNSFWRDEGYTGILIDRSTTEIIKVMANENNPPLHPIIAHWFVEVFGRNEFVSRLPSLLALVASFFLLRKIVKNKYKKEIVSVLFLSSFHVYLQSTEARYYGILIFLTILSFMATQRVGKNLLSTLEQFNAKTLLRKDILFFVLANTLLLYNHTLAVFAYAGNFAVLLYKLDKNRKLDFKNVLKLCVIFAVPVLLFLPWIFVVIYQLRLMQNETGFWLTFEPIRSLLGVIVSFFYPDSWRVEQSQAIPTLSFFFYFIVSAYGFIKLYKEKKYKYLVAFFVPFALMYLASFKQPVFYIRYLLFLLPFVIIISAHGIHRSKQSLPLIFTTLILITNMGTFFQLFNKETKPPHRKIAEFIKTNSPEGTAYMNDNEYSYFECTYYLGKCSIVKAYENVNKSIGMSLVPRTDIIGEEEAAKSKNIAMIYWNDGYPTLEFLKDYKIVNEIHLPDGGGKLNAVIYQRK